MHLHYRNVNDAFTGIVTGMMNGVTYPTDRHARPVTNGGGWMRTVVQQSRNGRVIRTPGPHLITYSNPRERVLFNAARDANPFFHLFEALYMLAGRNDVEPLAYYAKQVREYSDDGKTFNGTYGYRWRKAAVWPTSELPTSMGPERVDQIDALVYHLKTNPTSRRAVLQMWNVEDDLLKVGQGRDVCCNLSVMFEVRELNRVDHLAPNYTGGPARAVLDMTVTNRSNDLCMAGETQFRSPEGTTSIAELAERFNKDARYRFPVYSVDTYSGEQRLSWMTRAWKSGTKPVLKVGFDDGTFVRFTADHVVYKKTKKFKGKRCIGLKIEEVEVGTLKAGDRLLADLPENAKCRGGAGYVGFKKNLFRNTSFSNLGDEHRAYWEFATDEILGDDEVHHRDENKANNRLSNLERIGKSEHRSHHMKKSNPNGKMTAGQVFARASKGGKTHKGRKLSEQHRQSLSEQAKVSQADRDRDGIGRYASNHKVLSIEPDGSTDVYDFTVPGYHNAVLSNGILTHNCWGMLGANYVTFTVLQEYLAARLGAEVGQYHHMTNNLHAYDEPGNPKVAKWEPEKWLAAEETADRRVADYRERDGSPGYPKMTLVPLVKDPAAFERELPLLVECYSGDTGKGLEFDEPFLRDVAKPMMLAFRSYKMRAPAVGLKFAEQIKADDWRIAATNWIQRRMNRVR